MPDQGTILTPDQSPSSEQVDKLANLAAELDFSQAEYKRFYANHVTATLSLFEIRVMFSSVQGIDPKSEKLVVDETLHVRMAPELALALVVALQKNLRDYVKLFGDLRPTKMSPPKSATSPSAPAPEDSNQPPASPEPTA